MSSICRDRTLPITDQLPNCSLLNQAARSADRIAPLIGASVSPASASAHAVEPSHAVRWRDSMGKWDVYSGSGYKDTPQMPESRRPDGRGVLDLGDG
jgi:hypothetical protein